MQLKDKVAVVLGASAEAGTGWAIAKRFAAEGAKVVVGARRIEPLRKLASEIGGTAAVADMGNEQNIIALAKLAVDTYGTLEIAVNAAGMPLENGREGWRERGGREGENSG